MARILNRANNQVLAASEVYSATPNADGNTSADLTSAKKCELPFEITQEGNYIISFINNGTGFDEFLLLDCCVKATGSSGILLPSTASKLPMGIYSPTGVKRQSLQRGLNIVITQDGKTRKVIH